MSVYVPPAQLTTGIVRTCSRCKAPTTIPISRSRGSQSLPIVCRECATPEERGRRDMLSGA